MKKLLLVCCIVLGVSTLSKAQGGGGGGQRQQPTAEETLARYKTALTLTDDQSAKVLVILKAQTKSNDSLRTAANGDFQAMRPAMTAIRTKYTAQIKAVLTPDQATAFDKLQPAGGRGGNRGGGAGGGGGTPPPPQR